MKKGAQKNKPAGMVRPLASPKPRQLAGAKRGPVVVVMGHIDHGKTTLLDYIRKSHVAEKEAGAITQHIGAYQAQAHGSAKGGLAHTITFLDTPGHEAFAAIRSRGAAVADLAVLVIAADEGVKAQTKEAYEIIKQAALPFIVAFNKIDKPDAKLAEIKKQLGELQIFIEEWGGDVPAVEISAKTGKGIDELLELIGLVAELKGMAADATKPAEGVVLESCVDARRGVETSVLVRDGTLHVGDHVVTGSTIGRVRSMRTAQGQPVTQAGPSVPVQVIGFKNIAPSGSTFHAAATLEEARVLAATAITPPRVERPRTPGHVNADTVHLVIKADRQGSLEAIRHALKTLAGAGAKYQVVREGIGDITVNDLEAAVPDKALVFGFQVAVPAPVATHAKHLNIAVRTYQIIYELIDTVKAALEGKLKPVTVRDPVATIRVLAVFRKERGRMIVGGRVQEGKARRGVKMEIIRNGAAVGRGKIMQLKQEKEDVATVGKDRDCGIAFEGDPVAEVGDTLELFEEREEIPKSL